MASEAGASKSGPVGTGEGGPVQTAIETKLVDALSPSHLEVVNESYKHSVPKGSESHFKVTIVSQAFEPMKLIDRHKAVHATLAEELAGPIHALSIQAKTPAQWAKAHAPHETPNCLGGSKHDAKA